MTFQVINPSVYGIAAHHALHHLCLVSESNIFYFLLMSACHNPRLCSPLKTVLNSLGDTYQAYCNTYKTHTMATHHGGSRQPLDRDATPTGKEY